MEAFQFNKKARKLHSKGMRASEAGKTEAARILFKDAQTVLGLLNVIDSDDLALQSAIIERDDGLTYVKDALERTDQWQLGPGKRKIGHSLVVINDIIDAIPYLNDFVNYPAERNSQLSSERQVSIDGLRRIADISRQVFYNPAHPNDQPTGGHDLLLRR